MLGGDLTVSSARMRSIDNQQNRILIKSPDSKNINFFWAFNLLLNCALGSDPLFTPYCFQTGVVEALVISLGLAILTQLSFYIFTFSWRFGTEFDYVNIWSSIYGNKNRWFPNLLILICYLTIATSYSHETWEELQNIILHFVPSCPEWIVSDWLLSYIMSFIALVFGIFAKSFADLRYISLASNIGMVVAGAFIVVLFALKITKVGLDPDNMMILWEKDPQSPATNNCLATFATIYFIHPFVYHIIIDFDRPTVGRVQALTISVTSFSFLFNSLIGLCGYFTLYDMEPGENILVNFDDSFESYIIIMVYVAKIFNYICIILSLTMFFYLISFQFTEMVIPSSSKSRTTMFMAGLCVMCLNVAFNFISESFFDWFNVVSQFCFLFLIFILPFFFYFSSFKFTRPFSAICTIFICAVGAAIQLYIIIQSIRELLP